MDGPELNGGAERLLPGSFVRGWTGLYGSVGLTWVDAVRIGGAPEDAIHRLVLWNIDLTLVDVARVTRAAYAEAFEAVAGRPLIQLPQMAGRSESEIFFDALALNGVDMRAER